MFRKRIGGRPSLRNLRAIFKENITKHSYADLIINHKNLFEVMPITNFVNYKERQVIRLCKKLSSTKYKIEHLYHGISDNLLGYRITLTG